MAKRDQNKLELPSRALARPPSGQARFLAQKGASSSDIVYQKLHRAIVAMELMPGTAISETRLAAEHGVSRTPVRQAIKRLAKDQLVETVPQSGTFVGRIPISSMLDSWIIRRTLEAEMVRSAAKKATGDDIAHMRSLLDAQWHASEENDLELFHEKDDELHQSFCAVAGHPRIWDHIRHLKVQLDRYRRLTLPQSGRIQTIIEEHTAVVDGIAEGDSDKAATALQYHLGKLKLDLDEFRGLWPDYFVFDAEPQDEVAAEAS